MEISDLLNKESIVVDLSVRTKKQALEEISKLSGSVYGLEYTEIEDVIFERESLGSTGLGKGIAIPHGRLEHIEKPVGVLVKLKDPIDYEAIDEELVDIIFLLLAPGGSGADHLSALSVVSGLLKDANKREAIRRSSTVEEIIDIVGI